MDSENEYKPRSISEVVAIVEALIFVADEPLTEKVLAEVLEEDRESISAAVEELKKEYDERESGLQLREIAGGWQISTRTEFHEEVRKFLKTRPSAKLSLASLETLAVIAYKQPVTVPEILEIRGVQSASAIKTLLDKRLIVAKGRKETVGSADAVRHVEGFPDPVRVKRPLGAAEHRGLRRPGNLIAGTRETPEKKLTGIDRMHRINQLFYQC